MVFTVDIKILMGVNWLCAEKCYLKVKVMKAIKVNKLFLSLKSIKLSITIRKIGKKPQNTLKSKHNLESKNGQPSKSRFSVPNAK